MATNKNTNANIYKPMYTTEYRVIGFDENGALIDDVRTFDGRADYATLTKISAPLSVDPTSITCDGVTMEMSKQDAYRLGTEEKQNKDDIRVVITEVVRYEKFISREDFFANAHEFIELEIPEA